MLACCQQQVKPMGEGQRAPSTRQCINGCVSGGGPCRGRTYDAQLLVWQSSACVQVGTFMRLKVSMASDRWSLSQRAVIMASYTCALAAQPCCCPRASSSAAC